MNFEHLSDSNISKHIIRNEKIYIQMNTIRKKLDSKLKVNVSICKDIKDEILLQKECSLITDEIYLSCYRYSLDYEYLKREKFTHIINCAAGSKRCRAELYQDFSYLLIDLKDEPQQEIQEAVFEVVKFIEKASEDCPGRKILIHCNEGISRGPMLVCSYLMFKYQLNKEMAIKMIKDKRSFIDINLGFIYQLEKLEKKILSTF